MMYTVSLLSTIGGSTRRFPDLRFGLLTEDTKEWKVTQHGHVFDHHQVFIISSYLRDLTISPGPQAQEHPTQMTELGVRQRSVTT